MGAIPSREVTERNAKDAFYRAAKKGDIPRARRILAQFPQQKLAIINSKKFSPLEAAVTYEYPRFIQFLIDHGVDLEQRLSGSNHTGLHLALLNHNMKIALLLFEAGAKIPVMDDELTALDFVISTCVDKKRISIEAKRLAIGFIIKKTVLHENLQLWIMEKASDMALFYRLHNNESITQETHVKIKAYLAGRHLRSRMAELMLMPFEQFIMQPEVLALCRKGYDDTEEEKSEISSLSELSLFAKEKNEEKDILSDQELRVEI
ncbi:MAG: ankyrin repeat domain-containing protein [Gammaproteobacteria bacterium]|nr:ankyrin repeat domain-containing protein [Gammaproteobacteria bacterium]